MSLTIDGRGVLPPKRHRMAAADAHDLFVVRAPFPDTRQRIWEAFLAWVALVRPLVPAARLWVDGGFVTHKSWAAPRDVDVCLIASPDECASLDLAALAPLLTDAPDGGPRIQPMGGLVDAHLGYQSVNAYFWADLWTTVLDEARAVVPGERKGFLEVIDL